MNSTTHASHFPVNAHQASTGATTTAAPQAATSAHQDLTSTESSVFLTLHATTEESGTIPSVNVSAHKEPSPMGPLVSDVPLDNFTPTEDATAQMEPSSMELNAPSELLKNVSAFQTPTGMELTASVSQASQPMETHASVTVSSLETSVKDVPQSQTQSGPTESVNATTDTLMLMVFVPLSPPSQSNATLEPSSTLNFKSVFHALMDVLPARPVTIVLNADLTTLLMSNQHFVLKFVVMERDTLHNAMTETTSMVTDAAKIAELKSVSHATEVHQLPETHAAVSSHQLFKLKTEVNQDFTER